MRLTPLAAAAATLALATACAPADESPSSDSSSSVSLDQCKPADLDLYKAGTLTIATDSPAYEPWFTDDDPTNGKGYEGAVARAVAEKLGFAPEKVTWVTQGFNEAIKPGAKSFDFDINQFSITSEREKVVDFSSPYYKAKQGVITLADSKYADVTSLAGLKDAKVGAQVGTTSLEATQQLGLTTDPLVYDDTTKAAQALQNAFYLVAAELDGAKLVGQFEPRTGESEEFGLLLDKDSALTPCVSAAVDALKDDGTLEKLQQQWLSDAVDVPELSQS
jgi:polar amino acid transport system substrate-binding protein